MSRATGGQKRGGGARRRLPSRKSGSKMSEAVHCCVFCDHPSRLRDHVSLALRPSAPRSRGRKPKPVGRPKIARNLCELVKRLAKENAGWGYRRIIGELRKLRLRIGRSSVRRILKEAGKTPSPYRRGRAEEMVWRKFIRLHMNTLVACDFFTKSVITPLGVQLAYCLVFIHVGTRKVFLSPPA